MKRFSLVLLGSAMFAAACGQRLVDFYNDHDDAGTHADMHVQTDLSGVDLHAGDLATNDLATGDGGLSDAATAHDLAGVDLQIASSTDMNLACHALSLPGISGAAVPIVTAGPANPDYYNPSGAITVEAWVYPTAQASASVLVAHSGDPGTSNASYYLWTNASGHLAFSISANGSTFVTSTSTGTVPLNTWTHVVGEYAPSVGGALGGTMSTWINGTQDGTMTTPVLFVAHNVSTPLAIGAFSTAVSSSTLATDRDPFVGYMHDVRVSSTARYAAIFTPARRLSSDASTLALYHLDDPVGTSTAADSSSHAAPGTLLDNAAFANLGSNQCP